MGIVGIIWVILIVLKFFGLALVTASWFWVIIWPIVPLIIFAILALVFGVSAAGFASFRSR